MGAFSQVTCASAWAGVQAPEDLGKGAIGSPHRNLKLMDGDFSETLGTPKSTSSPCSATAAVTWGFVTFN